MTQPSNELLSLARPLVEMLQADGYSLDELGRRCGFTAEGLHTPGQTISVAGIDELWRLAYEAHGETAGLEAGRLIKLVDIQEVGMLIASTDSVKEGLSALQHYLELLTELVEINASASETGLELTARYKHPLPHEMVRLDNTALLGRTLTALYLESPLRIARVELTRPKPKDPTPWEEAFLAPIRWNSPITRVCMDAAESARPQPSRNPQLRSALQLMLDTRLDQRRQIRPLGRIRMEIIRQLPQATPTLETVAQALHMSTRSLQRQLQMNNASFSNLLSDIRHDLAKHYLKQGMTVDQTSSRLGYADSVVFHRAFKRWTGQTPLQFRKISATPEG